ncbi:MAG: glutamate--tRNA ligase [DPANN group archaeon]|nr:glutamate--tRNA ligase [DPANN group archaeon]
MADIKARTRELALLNAKKFEGKANPKALLGALLAEFPDYRKNIKGLQEIINTITNEINSMTIAEQERAISKEQITDRPKKEKRTGLPELKNAVKGQVVMRMEPSPSGPLHIGHAFPLILNSEYCRMYDGKMILRISDTNANNIYTPAYKMIEEDARWLTNNKIDSVIIQSDRMELYYRTMRKLIEKNHAYVCTCKPEDFKKLTDAKTVCPCRNQTTEKNMKRWQLMFKGYKEGEAVVRIKTDIKHKNPAVRDWPAARINDEPHPRTKNKYRVWPLMNFAVAVDDHDLGLTHIIKGKDHITNTERQMYMYDYLNWKHPEFIHIGRINFKDFIVSTSQTRKAIDEKIYEGWDDVRIPFIRALKRRGFQPEAIQKIVIETGPSKTDKTVEITDFFKTIEKFNRDIIDSTSHRLFFVENPTEIILKDVNKTIEIENHPDNKTLGTRKIEVKEIIAIAQEDYNTLKKRPVRLRKLADGILDKNFKTQDLKNQRPQVIQWVPNSSPKATIQTPNGNTMTGLVEKDAQKLKEGDIIQFERVGFCRLDKKNPLIFCFTHK